MLSQVYLFLKMKCDREEEEQELEEGEATTRGSRRGKEGGRGKEREYFSASRKTFKELQIIAF